MSKPSITVHVTEASSVVRSIQGRVGRSLMQAAVDAGIDGIAADCGGCLSCATCHVFVDDAWRDRLPAVSSDESSMLEMTAVPAEAGSRLSCQIELHESLDGLQVRLPPKQY